jgi:Fe-S-cluster containining protein
VPVINSPELCISCNAKCCRYFMLEIDAPTRKSDFENIRWYLCHHDTTIYVEKGNKWYLHILSPCRYLTNDGRCSVYETRPEICREHDPAECEFDMEYEAKIVFTSLDEFDSYIEKRFSKDKRAEEVTIEAASLT